MPLITPPTEMRYVYRQLQTRRHTLNKSQALALSLNAPLGRDFSRLYRKTAEDTLYT